MHHFLVITTCPDPDSAGQLAASLLKDRLAACINIVPGVRSLYEWKGELVTDEENILLIKTSAERYERLEQAIRERHPYELPEVIAVPIQRGSGDYLAWINSLVDGSE